MDLHTEKFVYFILNHVIQIFVVIFRDEFHKLKFSCCLRQNKVSHRRVHLRESTDPHLVPQSPGGLRHEPGDVSAERPCALLRPSGLTPKLPEASSDLPTLGDRIVVLGTLS